MNRLLVVLLISIAFFFVCLTGYRYMTAKKHRRDRINAIKLTRILAASGQKIEQDQNVQDSDMSQLIQRPVTYFSLLILLGFTVQISGCASDSNAAKGAGKGATTGALAGAVGGMATALIFGGNVGEAAARGAVYGGASGAVVGGMSGASVDKQIAAQEQAEREQEREQKLAKFREEIGTDAFNGFVALAECKHDIAIANAREARKSRNRDYSLAGLWVEALTQADRQNPDAARELFPELVSSDKAIKTVGDAELRTGEALQRLGEIRVEYDLPKDCSS